jgi:glycosyltransferase involved in cell wall biosynthesis
MGIPLEKISVVPSGVDTRLFAPFGREAARHPGLRRVLAVGRLVERKGFDDLIAAMRGLPDTELVIVGGPSGDLDSDPEARRLRELATVLGLRGRVRLVGPVRPEAMPTWYRSADVLACVPWYEPFGLTPLEAMACGVPVVAYAVGGLKDTIVDGVTGAHVAPGDLEALIRALSGVLANHARRGRLGVGARLRMVTRCDWSFRAAEINRVYAELHPRARLSAPVIQ